MGSRGTRWGRDLYKRRHADITEETELPATETVHQRARLQVQARDGDVLAQEALRQHRLRVQAEHAQALQDRADGPGDVS